MSAASAKVAPVEDDPLVDIQDTLAHYYNTKTRIPRNVLFGLIEATNKVRKMAPPAAERTALKELYEARGLVKQCLDGTDSLGVIVLKLKTVKSRLDEIIDAQERAEPKA